MINHAPEKTADVTAMVQEMFDAFSPSTDPKLWLKLIVEETAECREAIVLDDKLNGLKEVADLAYVVGGLDIVLDLASEDEIAELEDEAKRVLGDAFHAASEIMDYFGYTSEQTTEAFRRVHVSNMTKLGDDGKPIRREDGKIMKGPNYREPDLTDLI